jgi:hypothetical protein
MPTAVAHSHFAYRLLLIAFAYRLLPIACSSLVFLTHEDQEHARPGKALGGAGEEGG